MHVFVLTCSWISEHTMMTETVGVYAHMHQTISPARLLKAEGKNVLVTKHEVIDARPDHRVAVGGIPGLVPVGEGGPTDPSVAGSRA